jgi:hypothetical protein
VFANGGTTMKSAQEIQDGLAQFYGTEQYHKLNAFSNLKATDGVAWLCQNADCFWLIDIICSYQKKCMKDQMLCDMQFWTLTAKNNKGLVICERDTGDIAIKQVIDYTDFPLPEIKIWVENGVMMLPSER